MARSFSVPSASGPDDLAVALAEARMAVKAPAGGIVFVSGGLTGRLPAVMNRVRAEWRGLPVAVVPAAGVLTERGEIEGADAASGLLWSGGTVTAVAVPDSPEELSESLAGTLAQAIGSRVGTAVLFAEPESFHPPALDVLAQAAPNTCLLGAGTAGRGALVASAEGEVMRGRMAGLVVTGLAPPVAEASPACRLLMPLTEIDEASNGMVLRVGGRPALEALSECAAQLGGTQQLVFAAIADGTPAATLDDDPAERYVVRPVRGLDSARRGVLIGPDAVAGARLAFAARDAAASRAQLEATARRVAQLALGAVPRFALYLSCAGRGQGLYGAPDVDTRILKQRFPELPIAGMHSAFEIAPWGHGRARMQLYTGVLALFRSPS